MTRARRSRVRRRGLSLVEVLVAVALLAVLIGGILTFSQQETRSVGATEERFVATLLLAELREAFGGRPALYYQLQGFPPRFEDFNALHRTFLEQHPATVPAPPGQVEGPAATLILQRMQAMQVRRAVLFEPVTLASGAQAGVVTFEVRYRNAAGKPRSVRSVQFAN